MDQNKIKRLTALIEAAGRHDLDWVLCTLPENIFYYSGFRTMFYTRFIAVLIPVKEQREPVLSASYIDTKLVEDKIWSPHWFNETAVWGPAAAYKYKTHLEVLQAYFRPGLRLGVDAIQFDLYDQLRREFAGVSVVSLQGEILGLRMVKDEEEIGRIKAAFVLAEKIMAQVPGWLQSPMTEKDLAAEMNYSALKAGAEDIFYPTLVSCGPKMQAYHSPPLVRPIEPDQLIRVAFGLQVGGYGSDIVRTFCKGTPPQAALPLKEAFFEAQEAVVGLVKPGITSAEMIGKVEEIYQNRGCLNNWSRNIGHGLALTIHEPPRMAGPDKTLIRQNMVLAIEPSLACPPHGAFAHCDGVRVTATGGEWLSHELRDLIVV